MILLLLFEVHDLPTGLAKGVTFFPEFLPDELDLFVLLLLEVGQFGALEVLEAFEVATPGILKVMEFMLIGRKNRLLLLLMVLAQLLEFDPVEHRSRSVDLR